MQPTVTTEALLASARAGAEVRTGVEVTGAAPGRRRPGRRRHHAGRGVSADAVIVAAGPWSGEVAERLGSGCRCDRAGG